MRETPKRGFGSRLAALGLAVSFICSIFILAASGRAHAAQITGRTLTLGSSVASGVTTYTFTFTLPSATVLESFEAVICTTASGTCTTPNGFSNSSATLASQPTNLGDASGWSINTSTAGKLRIKKTTNAAAPTGSQTVAFNTVTNPDNTNTSPTFFAQLNTYTADNWTGTAVDTGTVAASTAGQINVTAHVDETLAFAVAGSPAALGTLSSGSTASATSTMTAATNTSGGYAITVNGTTLTSGSNTIAAMGTQSPNGTAAASSAGTAQFGINLVHNNSLSVGSAPSGGSGTYGTNYGTDGSFRFFTGDTVATDSGPTNTTSYTVTYIANITGSTPPGDYATTLTYIATATF